MGPNFQRPAAPKLDAYGASPTPAQLTADGATQSIEPGRPTDPTWWRQFGSLQLDGLVAAGLKNSPTLAAAQATLRQSEDLARAGAGVFLPSLSASFDAAREHTSPRLLGQNGPGSTFSLYTLAGVISYPLDLFGGERRSVEALNAQAEHDRYAVGAATLLLTGNIVNAAIAQAGYAEQAQTLTDIIALDAAQRDILNTEYRAGYGALSAALAAEQQLAADRQSLAIVRQRQSASITLLHTLLGREPAEGVPDLPALGGLTLPREAPVSLPSQLVRQRPDILQAEALLHQASAQVGVATAALYPSITLTGDFGSAAASLGRLSGAAGRFWSFGPTIDIPIFHGGSLWFNRRAAQAAYQKAAEDYRQTVLAALEQVADQLKAMDADAEISDAARNAADAAALNHALATTNLEAGLVSGYEAMSVQIQSKRLNLTLIAARSQRLQDVVGLYLASGGGWSSKDGVSGPAAAP